MRSSTPRVGAVRSLSTGLALLALFAWTGGVRADEREDDSARVLTALVLVETRITLDGVLDEQVWRDAEVGTGFIQREPDPGQPASERTEVRVAHSASTLYVGIFAYDSIPGEIIAEDMRRDGEGNEGGGPGGSRAAYRNDDSVALVLDTFHDGRNAFYFETNPTGARADALIEDEGRANFDWDGVWTVAARRNEEGWVAEIAIPFSTLRFDPGTETWGFNVKRLIRRYNQEVYWSPIGIEADVSRVSQAGTLVGIQGPDPGINLRVKPFGVGSSGKDFVDDSLSRGEEIDAGLDLLRWGITDSLTLDATANTDFAQVEADEQRVNLTRFSLFFPEKREFFLENAGIFDFGSPGGGGGFRPPFFVGFFSRRIGLDSGDIVPLRAGARLSGRIGGWNIGLMDAQTGSFERSADDDDPSVPSTNWGVFRAKRNIGSRSTIGAIVTNRQAGGDDWNRMVGFDADINPSSRVNLSAFVARTSDSSESTGWAGGAGFAWRGSTWRANLDVQDIREEFNPEMGFLLREGVRRYNTSVDFEPRPDIGMGIRNLSFHQRSEVVTTSDGTVETIEATLRFFGFQLRSGDRVTFFGGYNFERLFEPFEIRDGIVIPPGEYHDNEIGVFINTDGSRRLSLFAFGTKGGFFDGSRLMINSSLTARISRNLSLDASWNHNDVDMAFGQFTTNVIQQRVNVAFSPDLFVNAFGQYNSADELTTLNVRFNWIYRPGADLFVVYNQDWDTGDGFDASNRALILKFTYLLIL